MDDKLHFAVDLYHGTAEYYDRYRLPYPEAMIEDLIARRVAARKAKDFALADALRAELTALDVEVMDNPTGATWRLKERV